MHKFKMLISNKNTDIVSDMIPYEDSDGFIFYLSEMMCDEKYHGYDRMLHSKGVAVRETDTHVEIINDPFCSLPIYVYASGSLVIVTSRFEDVLQYSLTVDTVGYYEMLLYESPLHDRTIFSEVKQLPAAGILRINKTMLSQEISTYWDFDIVQDTEMNSEEMAVEAVWNQFCGIFESYKGKKLLMGISGGLDSRLSMCAMKATGCLDGADLFTFGHYEGILDYKLAKRACLDAGYRGKVQFYTLDGESYLKSSELPIKSGGTVGIQHSHAYSCLKAMSLEGKVLVSNYYSDAIMGYDCMELDYPDTVENCAYYKKVQNNEWNMPSDIQKAIENDIVKIANRRREISNFSCYDEFIYLVERNPKFHIRLSYIYSQMMDSVLPYANYDMLVRMISLPKEYRYGKRIEQLILKTKFMDMEDISSSRYSKFEKKEKPLAEKLHYNLGFIRMRVINLLNCGMNVLSKGCIQIPNPYITENHLAVINRYFYEQKKEACRALHERGLLDAGVASKYAKFCRRTHEAQKGFALLNAWLVIKEAADHSERCDINA